MGSGKVTCIYMVWNHVIVGVNRLANAYTVFQGQEPPKSIRRLQKYHDSRRQEPKESCRKTNYRYNFLLDHTFGIDNIHSETSYAGY